VQVNGIRFDDTGFFRFAIVDSGGLNLWTNDGTQLGTSIMPTTTVNLPVTNGIYSVQLGESPMLPIPSSVFDDDTRRLRIWFDDGTNGAELLSPDHDLTSTPYAHHAANADKLEGNTVAEILSAAATSPVGTIVAFAGPTPPAGWLPCNGDNVSRVTYANLYSVIGDTWGYGDQISTFNLPDLRGRFLRGRDGGVGNDPDAGLRTECNAGGATGDSVGSIQGDVLQGHWHRLGAFSLFAAGSGGGSFNIGHSGNTNEFSQDAVREAIDDNTGSGAPRTSSETRPKNAYVNYIIKY
jgi:microcystin-dependent protein